MDFPASDVDFQKMFTTTIDFYSKSHTVHWKCCCEEVVGRLVGFQRKLWGSISTDWVGVFKRFKAPAPMPRLFTLVQKSSLTISFIIYPIPTHTNVVIHANKASFDKIFSLFTICLSNYPNHNFALFLPLFAFYLLPPPPSPPPASPTTTANIVPLSEPTRIVIHSWVLLTYHPDRNERWKQFNKFKNDSKEIKCFIFVLSFDVLLNWSIPVFYIR